MSRAVQITYLVPIDDEVDEFPDQGVAGQDRGFAEIIEDAQFSMAELIAQEGVQGGIIVDMDEGYDEHLIREQLYAGLAGPNGEPDFSHPIDAMVTELAGLAGMAEFPPEPFEPDHPDS